MWSKAEIFEAGQTAYWTLGNYEDNPHEKNSESYFLWVEGWEEAEYEYGETSIDF